MSDHPVIEAEIVMERDGEEERHVLKIPGGREERLLKIKENARIQRWRIAASGAGIVAFFFFCSTCVFAVCGPG